MTRRVIISIVAVLIAFLIFSAVFFVWRNPIWSLGAFSGRLQSSITMDRAKQLAENYLISSGNDDLAIDEIIEFEYNFYIVYYEKSTGIGAFEGIIDKAGTGGMGMMYMMGSIYVRPEQGPNMMWNMKYGMHGIMGGWNGYSNSSVTVSQAKMYAQKYLDGAFSDAVVGDVHLFYGYYTIHVMRNDRVYGMLSVNGFTGQVWYHNWHGSYVQSLELRGS